MDATIPRIASHIIEPIGQIVARQASVTQRRLPDEDARSLIFDDTNLFEVTKFSGYDRTEMGTRANVGMQYTFQSNDGGYARFLAGQSFHLSGDNVYANPGLDADGTSDLLSSKRPRNCALGLRARGLHRSDGLVPLHLRRPASTRTISLDPPRRCRRAVNYGPIMAQANYAYTASDTALGLLTIRQDIPRSAMLRLTDNWSIGAGFRYDIDAAELRQDSIQVKYPTNASC